MNLVETLLDNLASDLTKKREDQVREKLKEFNIPVDEEYLKTNCEIKIGLYNNYTLFHKGTPILSWNTNVKIEQNYSAEKGLTVTAIMG